MKKEWTITQDAFSKLLARFDGDVERAGEKYELTRSQLIKYFECRGCRSPGDLADEAINRVARKIAEGEDIPPQTFSSYFYGVARNISKEHLRDLESAASPLELLAASEHPLKDPSALAEAESGRSRRERRLECLDACVKNFPPETREMLISYYEGEEGVKIRNRKRMAKDLGISLNNLRTRVYRLRERLEKCISECVNRKAGE